MIPDPEALGGVLRLGSALGHIGTGDAPCPACAATGRVVGSVGDVAEERRRPYGDEPGARVRECDFENRERAPSYPRPVTKITS